MLLALATLGAKAQVEWTIWEGTIAGNNVSLTPQDFTNIAQDDILYIYASGTTDKGLAKQTGNWTWNEISSGWTLTNDGENYYYTLTAENVSTLTDSELKAFIVKNSNNSGTISKVTIRKKNSMIKTELSNTEVSFGNWANGYWSIDNSAALSKVVTGDYFYIPATRQTGKYTENSEEKDINYWQAQIYDGTNSSPTWKYSINSFSHDMWAQVQSSDVSNITSNKISANGQFYNCTGLYIYHPLPSFSIGSIGMATFSADVAVRVPDGIEAYRATLNGAKTAITLTKIDDGIIPANTGVIIKGTEGTVVEFTATTTENSVTSALSANVSATTLAAGDYVLYNNGGTAEFRKVTATQLAANKAYLPASALLSSPAPSLSISFDGMGNTTGISNVQKTVVEDNRIYNLNGQEVKNAGKGIFIKNGKKYIIK